MLTTKKQNLLNRLSKPIFAQGSINLNVHRYITDVDGRVLVGGVVPTIMRKNFPVFLLGNYDRIGGYTLMQKTIAQPSQLSFLCTYVQGVNLPMLFATGFNEVFAYFRTGDIITVWVDDFNNPNYFAFIQQTVQNGSVSSIISNPENQQIEVENVSLQVDNENQLNKSWQITWFDNRGNTKNNPVNVGSIYRGPFYRLTDFIDLNISFELSHYMGITFLMLYDSQEININFRINN
jgi:hypothetical protein